MNAKLMIVAALLSGCATVSPMQHALERENAAATAAKAEMERTCGDDALCKATVAQRIFVPAAVCRECASRYVNAVLRIRIETKDPQEQKYRAAMARNQYMAESDAYVARKNAAALDREMIATSMLLGNMQRTQANATALGVANTLANSPYYRPVYPMYPLYGYGW